MGGGGGRGGEGRSCCEHFEAISQGASYNILLPKPHDNTAATVAAHICTAQPVIVFSACLFCFVCSLSVSTGLLHGRSARMLSIL